MDRALRLWHANQLDEDGFARLQRYLTRSYVVYGDMILLSASLVDGQEWKQIKASEQHHLLECICKCMGVTRIAVTRPIPLLVSSAPNTFRSPIDFEALYGDLGSATASDPPTEDDYSRAYWVTARQNGIAQTWAPRWTMFSRGNIVEKARVLNLETVAEAAAGGCTAVDLYAGIGYFTFSYLKAGVSQVLCWELNDWSCEGLRRGALSNRWDCETYKPGCDLQLDARVVIFKESNELALERLQRLRSRLPPIRHVNCGLLPSSRPSWPTAFEAIDRAHGGWVHVHENMAMEDVAQLAEGVRKEFQTMSSRSKSGEVVLESVNRVKSYAPGVFHYVLDIRIPPCEPLDEE